MKNLTKATIIVAIFLLLLGGYVMLIKNQQKIPAALPPASFQSNSVKNDAARPSYDKDNGWSCETDSNCVKVMKNSCDEREKELGIGGDPFCIDGYCTCACGHRSKDGQYVEQLCQ
ncbi:MAG: hypothetical protein WCW77_01515 [Patescibacteria group bacterium]|jgi:hypothetical protein